MKYIKQTGTTGSWIKGSDLEGIEKATILTETKPEPSRFKNKDGSIKMQDVCKIKFDGKDEVFNISLNKATLNGLIDAFGEDSNEWVKKILAVETEKVRVGGVARTAIYLVPEGYEKVDNEEGFAEIIKIGGEKNINQPDDIPVIDEEEIDTKDIPF